MSEAFKALTDVLQGTGITLEPGERYMLKDTPDERVVVAGDKHGRPTIYGWHRCEFPFWRNIRKEQP